MTDSSTQYRVTSPGGYEQFYSDYSAALDHYNKVQGVKLEYADDRTDGKWVELDPKNSPFKRELRNLLRFD